MNFELDPQVVVIKVVVVVLALVQVVPVMLWVERRGSALMQNRLGPNRVGPLGFFHAVSDALKFVFKEDIIPAHVDKYYYLLAPILAVIPAFMTCAAVPFAAPFNFSGITFTPQLADLNIGVLYILAITSLSVYAIIIAGWSTNNKFALLGSIRSTAQMISYELSMGLSIVGVIMINSSVKLGDIVANQAHPLVEFAGYSIPSWGLFVQPVGFIIFLICIFAETNRLPFDLAEGESEIVAGYHLEYGALKFALFFLAEYVNMAIASAVLVSLFLGGYQQLPGMSFILEQTSLQGDALNVATAVSQLVSLVIKIGLIMWLFVWVRWTLPRFRFDQLMNLGWKVLFPVALTNVLITAFLIYRGVL